MTMKTATKFLYVLVPFVASFVFAVCQAHNVLGISTWFIFASALFGICSVFALVIIASS